MNLNTGSLSNVNGIMNESAKLDKYSKDSSLLTKSSVVPKIKDQLKKMKEDIKLSYTGTDVDAPAVVLSEWQKYTDSSVRILIISFYFLIIGSFVFPN